MTASMPLPPVQPPEWTPPGRPPWQPTSPPSPPAPSSLPMIVEPAQSDVYSRLLDERIVLITGPLDDSASRAAVAALVLLDRRNASAVITMHLSCPAADLEPALGLMATIELVGAPVTIIATGVVRGAAVAVYAVADRRMAHPHARFELAPSLAEVSGNTADVTSAAEEQLHREQLVVDAIARASGNPADAVRRDIDARRVLPAAEAIDYGLVTSIADRNS